MTEFSSENPYASPLAPSAADDAATDAEVMRRKYLSHEASVKSIGTLYILGAIFTIPLSLLMFVGAVGRMREPYESAIVMGVAFFYLTVGVVQAVTAVGIRRLRPWARGVAIALSTLGLLAVPIGTLIAAYFLYLLLSKKGQMVFSPEYAKVIEQTPHIKYKTSVVVIILLILLLVLLTVAIVVPLVINAV